MYRVFYLIKSHEWTKKMSLIILRIKYVHKHAKKINSNLLIFYSNVETHKKIARILKNS